MMRREFIVAIAGTVAWPLGARAQPDRMRHVGPRRQSHRIIVMSAYDPKRTLVERVVMSVLCQKQTSAIVIPAT